MVTRTFTKSELLEDFGLPWGAAEDVKVISDKVIDNQRWSIDHELIFQLKDQAADRAWRVHYSVGATEMQDERPWQYDDKIEATEMQFVETVVRVWEPVK